MIVQFTLQDSIFLIYEKCNHLLGQKDMLLQLFNVLQHTHINNISKNTILFFLIIFMVHWIKDYSFFTLVIYFFNSGDFTSLMFIPTPYFKDLLSYPLSVYKFKRYSQSLWSFLIINKNKFKYQLRWYWCFISLKKCILTGK